MITIDGSSGEGGGQVLRSALALSMETGKAFRIINIRANRRKPGLLHQHLTAVKAACAICNAEVSGASLHSSSLTFTPGAVESGQWTFSVGTAGSTTLVLQTILPALMTARQHSQVTLLGGTHNPWAPPFDFLEKTLLPLLNRMGPRVSVKLIRPGFFPAGGGELVVDIQPAEKLQPLVITEQGKLLGCNARALLANLPRHIAQRELGVVRQRLGWQEESCHVEEITNSAGPGNVVLVEMEFEHLTEVFVGFGQLHVPAEKVAEKAASQAKAYLDSGASVGPYLADQLLVPMAISKGRFFTVEPTLHTRTNIELISRFLDTPITTRLLREGIWEIRLGD